MLVRGAKPMEKRPTGRGLVVLFLAFLSHKKSKMQENQQDERIQKSISCRN
jgi:hypothetical protein